MANYSKNAETFTFSEGIPPETIATIRKCLKETSEALPKNAQSNSLAENNLNISNYKNSPFLTIVGIDTTNSTDYIYKFKEDGYDKGSLKGMITMEDPTRQPNNALLGYTNLKRTIIKDAINTKKSEIEAKMTVLFKNDISVILKDPLILESLNHYLKNMICKSIITADGAFDVTYPISKEDVENNRINLDHLKYIYLHYNILQTVINKKTIDQYIDGFSKVQAIVTSQLPAILDNLNVDDINKEKITNENITYINSKNNSINASKYGQFYGKIVAQNVICPIPHSEPTAGNPTKLGLCPDHFDEYFNQLPDDIKVRVNEIEKQNKAIVKLIENDTIRYKSSKKETSGKLSNSAIKMSGCFDKVKPKFNDLILNTKVKAIQENPDLIGKINAFKSKQTPPPPPKIMDLLHNGYCDTAIGKQNSSGPNDFTGGLDVPFGTTSTTLKMIIGLQYYGLSSLLTSYSHEFGHTIGAGGGSPELHIGRYANRVINTYFPREILYCAYKKSSGYENNHQACYGEHQADLIAILLLEKYIATVHDSEKIKEILSSFIWETGNGIDHSHPPGSLRRNLILLDKYLHDILKKDPKYQCLPCIKNIRCPEPLIAAAPAALPTNEKEQTIERILEKYIELGYVNDNLPNTGREDLRKMPNDEFRNLVKLFNDHPNHGGRRKFKKTRKNKHKKARKSTRRRRM